MAIIPSANFGFLETHDEQLVRLASLAGRYFADDPNTRLLKLRQFTELLVQATAARVGSFETPEESLADLLRRPSADRVVPREVIDLLHRLRKVGNTAARGEAGDHGECTPTATCGTGRNCCSGQQCVFMD